MRTAVLSRLKFGFGILAAVAVVSFAPMDSASAGTIVAKIDVSQQRMRVYVNGRLRHTWRVSTGKAGFATPRGSYGPKRMARMHYSRKYNNSPMPYSIFFRGGYAVHGTSAVRRLGRRASHGCVRLRIANARRLYSLVRRHGRSRSRIVVVN